MIDGGAISSDVLGEGDAGNITINANDTVNISGFTNFNGQFDRFSQISSSLESGATGNAGNINLISSNLIISNRSFISNSTNGAGNSGNVVLDVDGNTELINNSNIFSQVSSDGVGEGGTITLNTGNLSLLEGSQISAGVFGQGNAGTVTVNAADTITFQGINSNGLASGIITANSFTGMGNAGDIEITTNNLNLVDGGTISSNVQGEGDAGNITINANDTVNISGSTVFDENTTRISQIDSSVSSEATGNGGNIIITTPELILNDGGRISAITEAFTGNAGNLTFNIDDRLTLRDNSTISVEALTANGGDITINAPDGFVIGFPNANNGNSSNILASSETGLGGNIIIFTKGILGFELGASDPENPQDSTNRIDASSDFDGDFTFASDTIIDLDSVSKIVPADSEQTLAQACQIRRQANAKSGLTIEGKGGIVPEPGMPLNSLNVSVAEEDNSAAAIPEAIETSKGKIQPARGVKVTSNGEIILTAYRTNNAGQRIIEAEPNCGV